tara:strand:+ start:185 stop:358 length:174 start_codon:yes stop_codon:yes gene_type:complete
LTAKNLPVISKNDAFLGSLLIDRLLETLKSEENELGKSELINNNKLLEKYKKKTIIN